MKMGMRWKKDLISESTRVAFAFNTPSFSPRNARGLLLLLISVSLSFPLVMADLSDEKISEAYLDVRSDKSDTNWLLLDFETDRSDKLVLTATGSGGLAELKENLDDSKASFGYVRVAFSNDKESQREKFIFLKWIGKGCKVMRKAKISVQAADVKSVLRVFSIEVTASEKDQLEEEDVVDRLRKAGGASYDGV
ncbi:ADF-like domain-containing [Pyrrhoderma noxium]|uniref:ADF-like domain-containing n=1 Tax=Pyrrhoderma noxium TaxID=2282107 RepID=A0A286U725_9AGAM|nr:ADF-like domain-containing [Pyrrhoderma noxium]